MNNNAAYVVSAAFALALTPVLAGEAPAGSCGDGYRIEHEDADCLNANWNTFSELATVVVEADTEGAAEVDMERSCMAQFKASSASETCENVSAEFHEPDRCFVSALCQLSDTGYNSTRIEASWSDTARLSNCNGILVVGEC